MSEVEEGLSPGIHQKSFKRSPRLVELEMKESILSPGFRSAAAMAGWDEEALLIATEVVEDTPVRESSHRRSLRHRLKSPSSSSSNRKRRSRPADRIPAIVLCLVEDDEASSHKEVEMKGKMSENIEETGKERDMVYKGDPVCRKGLPCMNRLREELSCAICLEICYEPSTTTCGHSFCKKCLKCAAEKCGKRCPKCRQLISGKSCTVNTVLWNTIQLLFPEEVEPRKKKAAIESSPNQVPSYQLDRTSRHTRNRNLRTTTSSFRSSIELLGTPDAARSTRRRRLTPNQSEDAALAHRLQREEFLEAFRTSTSQDPSSIGATRARLRAMALGAYRRRNINLISDHITRHS